jgi:hypothetical protein
MPVIPGQKQNNRIVPIAPGKIVPARSARNAVHTDNVQKGNSYIGSFKGGLAFARPFFCSLPASIFIIAGVLALFIALITVSYHAVSTALANPVKSLRSE